MRQKYQASTNLIRAILNTAPPHIAKPDAPEGRAALDQFRRPQDWKAYRTAGYDVVAVSSLHSEGTIWGDARINHAFRAMHDSVHAFINAPFTLAGEYAVAGMTEHLLRAECPYLTDQDFRALHFEVVGQAEYFEVHGCFPTQQAEFIFMCMQRGLAGTLNHSLAFPFHEE